jgi:signal transduction histidine kinase
MMVRFSFGTLIPALIILVFPAVPAVPEEPDQAGQLTAVLETWMNLEGALYSDAAGVSAGSVPAAVEDFSLRLDRFTASVLFELYGELGLGWTKPDIDRLTSELSAALKAGDKKAVARSAKAIRAVLISWQRIDDAVSRRGFMWGIFSFTLFLVFLAVMGLVLWHLNKSLRFSRFREENAAAFSREIMKAQEKERFRISSELHDTALQDMIRLMHRTREAVPESSAEESLLDLEERIVKEVRGICSSVMPPDFRRIYLADSLEHLCGEFEKRTGIRCGRKIPEDLDPGGLSAEGQLQCYRIVQEALNNAEKHSGAREVTVMARTLIDGGRRLLRIWIDDDGRGFPRPTETLRARPRGGIGLRSIYERAAMIGAKLDLRSESGAGVTIRLEVPLGKA